MTAGMKMKRTSSRSNREDGDVTKAKIIEAAGNLFAQNGYDQTTCKQICEAADVNISAVNYHFGSREGLYEAVLLTMHDHMTNPSLLAELQTDALPAREKLFRLQSRMANVVANSDTWQVRLWLREVTSPSNPCLAMRERKQTLRNMMCQLLGEVTGKRKDDPTLHLCFLFMIAPFVAFLMAKQKGHAPLREVMALPPEAIAMELNRLIFSGLDSFAGVDSTQNMGAAAMDSPP